MTGKRKYGDGCAAAHALDLVGERWSLLIVRELLLGPKRFTELRGGLPGVSANVLTQRLQELEEAEVVQRVKLGPPASAWVYSLTDYGLELEPVLVHLGRWGRRSRRRESYATSSVDAFMLALRAHFDPAADPSLSAGVGLVIGDDRFVMRVSSGTLLLTREEPAGVDATLATDLQTLARLVRGVEPLEELPVTITGDETLARRVLATVLGPA